MPAIADITVKKNDGTTDIVFTGISPSSGDGTPAVWVSQSVGSAAAHHPEFRLSASEGNGGKRRNMRITAFYPQIALDTTTSLFSVVDSAKLAVDAYMPKTMADSDINEFVAQFSNLIKSALIQNCLKSGYSAT